MESKTSKTINMQIGISSKDGYVYLALLNKSVSGNWVYQMDLISA